ncbi:MAG: DNA polymerase III subunit [Clostridia bacterium]|nr:DNA polymerase III subunit [Clostridia bacterium]
MRFGDFVGNESVKKQLSAEIDGGRFLHALVLEGAVGSGRRTLAQVIARAAVCHTEGERPCGVCPACVKAVHPDIAVFGEEDTPLTVDTIRRLREEAYVLPNESAYRVMLLCDAQNMTPQAQNALLKILEEPPRHVLFILTCDNRISLLETIRSRCVCMTLSPVSWEEAAPLLRARLPHAEEEKLRRAHSLFGGYIGQVIRGVEDGTFRTVLELVEQFAAAVTEVSELPLLRLTARLEKDKLLSIGVLEGLRLVFRDALVLSYGGQALLSTAPHEARRLSERLSEDKLAALIEQTELLQTALQRNMNNTLFLTRLSACLRQAVGR